MAELNETSYRIMEVALRLFSEQGYYQTTTKQIAQEAEVNELTIFRHFNSKANLFQVTTQEYVIKSNIEKVLLEGLEGLDVETIASLLVRRIYGLYTQNTKLYKVQLKLADNEADFIKLKLSRKITCVLNGYFQSLVDENKIVGNPKVMVLMLINTLIGQLTIEILTNDFYDEISKEELMEECAKQFVALYKVK